MSYSHTALYGTEARVVSRERQKLKVYDNVGSIKMLGQIYNKDGRNKAGSISKGMESIVEFVDIDNNMTSFPHFHGSFVTK